MTPSEVTTASDRAESEVIKMTFEALVIGINIFAILAFFVVIFRPWRKALCRIEQKRAELDKLISLVNELEEQKDEDKV